MLPSNQGDIKNVALEPGRHQICNPPDSFDLRCESVTYPSEVVYLLLLLLFDIMHKIWYR